jgi:hypothetical protein
MKIRKTLNFASNQGVSGLSLWSNSRQSKFDVWKPKSTLYGMMRQKIGRDIFRKAENEDPDDRNE